MFTFQVTFGGSAPQALVKNLESILHTHGGKIIYQDSVFPPPPPGKPAIVVETPQDVWNLLSGDGASAEKTEIGMVLPAPTGAGLQALRTSGFNVKTALVSRRIHS